MKTLPSTIKSLADEAEFQLTVARENLEWLCALGRAVAHDMKHAKGRDTERLLGLINFLDDTNFSGVDDAIDVFKAASAEAATQNANAENVSRTSAEVQP
ncbi:hypothetical protein QLG12_15590 [Pseudomonas sp. V88_4]|uniref:hypothetical protein n=1 Tax=Pseudomonas sp. V88_4 TaxID=3044229 RepID=UPI00249F6B84|nr:hypothetical protein [Pseudomonas sp. V88_4]MDI3399636.1 hypothetical protein [Pseudomonas sp. V88_4]